MLYPSLKPIEKVCPPWPRRSRRSVHVLMTAIMAITGRQLYQSTSLLLEKGETHNLRVDPPYHDRTSHRRVQAHDPSSSALSFGACLMVKDDNSLLPEWLAYHYTVLPLRYVVIGVDYNSTQDPSYLLERWSKETELRYWMLPASNFSDRHGKQLTNDKSRKPTARESAEDLWKKQSHHALIHRQKGFLTTCAELLKKQGVRWTAFWDTDEYVVMNHMSQSERDQVEVGGMESNTSSLIRASLPLPQEDVTLAEVLESLENSNHVQACHTVPRLIVGALENRSCSDTEHVIQLAKSSFQWEHLSTLRYVQHAKKGDFRSGRYGKTLINLSRIPIETVQQEPRSIHRPFKQFCGPGYVHFPNAFFFLYHYIGSQERYLSRQDGRRDVLEWRQRSSFDEGLVCETGVHLWFPRFLRTVGRRRALSLLAVEPVSFP